MKTNRTNSKTLLTLSAAFAVLMIFGLNSDAFAAHHGHGHHARPHCTPHHVPHCTPHHVPHCTPRPHCGSHVGFYVAPRPSGYYRTVTEQVMVAPQRVEKHWVPPVYNTVKDSHGCVKTVKVRDGYMAQRVIPAQYQTVTRQVWVQSSSPSIGLGFGFRF